MSSNSESGGRPSHRMIERLGRMAMAGIFVHGGWNTWREPGGRVEKAAKLGLPDPERMTRLSGAAMAVSGTALGLGIKPRLAAVALLGSLVPTTLAGHRFWEEETEQGRAAQTTQFLKNLGLAGGLLILISKKR